METKICPHCKKEKNVSEFYKSHSSKDGLSYQCKQCIKGYNDVYYKKKKILRRKIGFRGSSAIGYKYELLALKLLKGGIHVSQDNFKNYGYDLFYKGKTVDVKMRNNRPDINFDKWFFRIGKLTADFYMLFCCKKNKIVKVLLIPKCFCRPYIQLGKISKYDIFQIANR